MIRASRRPRWQSLPLLTISAAAGRAVVALAAILVTAPSSSAQDPQTPTHQHMPTSATGWQLMQDGVVFLTFNHQGGSRGGQELVSQNWWMGMAQRRAGTGTLR